jgi:hypothetical protein
MPDDYARAEIEAMRKDVAILDEVVHALGIEDREDTTPVEAIEALYKRVEALEEWRRRQEMSWPPGIG